MRSARLRPTVRTQLTAAATVATLLMLAIASVVILTIQRHALTSGLDEALRQRADNIQPIDPSATALRGEGDREDSFAQLLDDRGAVVASSPNLAGAPAVLTPSPAPTAARLTNVRLDRPAGRFRVLATPVRSTGRAQLLVIGKNLDDVSQSVDVLRLTLALVCPVLGVLIGGLAWWLTGRTLRPVIAIRREVDGIHAGELHRRVPVPHTDDEIADLARTMNAMLERVESASTRQRQFVDDASHELRTPLTRMITELEVSIAHGGDPSQQTPMHQLLDEATAMQRLIVDLLYVARGAEGLRVIGEVDLDDLALAAATEVRAKSGVHIDTSGIAAARVHGDERALARAVTNLLENAVRHASSEVAISTASVDGWCEVAVEDDGAGIAPTDRARVFDRFTRLDEARSRDDGGSGLGLAIVRDIAELHGGTATASAAPLGGARVTITIPSADENRPI